LLFASNIGTAVQIITDNMSSGKNLFTEKFLFDNRIYTAVMRNKKRKIINGILPTLLTDIIPFAARYKIIAFGRERTNNIIKVQRKTR
jgi:hypothetical protein